MSDVSLEASWLVRAALVASVVLVGAVVAFLTAAVLLRLKNERKRRRWSELTARWEGPLLAHLAGERTAEEVLERVDPLHRKRFVDFLGKYASRLRGEPRARVTALAQPYLPLLVPQVTARRMERRARAVQTLGRLGEGRFDPVLIEALDDESPHVVFAAMKALSHSGNREFVPRLVTGLHKFRHWSVRYLATVLAGLGERAALPLRMVLADDARPERVRALAAEALADMPDPGAADVAAEVLASGEGGRDLCAAALRLLAGVGTRAHLGVVSARLGDPDEAVRAAAARAMGLVAPPEEGERLWDALADPSSWVVLHAAQALAALGRVDLLQRARAEGRAVVAVAEVLEEVAA